MFAARLPCAAFPQRAPWSIEPVVPGFRCQRGANAGSPVCRTDAATSPASCAVTAPCAPQPIPMSAISTGRGCSTRMPDCVPILSESRMREIRTSGSMSRGVETEQWIGLRHRPNGESRRQRLLPEPVATAPPPDSTFTLQAVGGGCGSITHPVMRRFSILRNCGGFSICAAGMDYVRYAA